MFGKLRAMIKELGFADAMAYGINRVIQRSTGTEVLYRYALVAQPVLDKPLLPPRRGRDIEIRILPGYDPVLAELELDADVANYRFRQDAICFCAYKSGAIVGCLWLCLGPYEEDEVRSRFVPLGAAWDLGLYVLPSQRGGMVFGRLWDEANAYLRARQIQWSLSRIGIANMGSLTSHARLGARRFGSATYLCIGPLQLMIATERPFVHLSWSTASAPVLRLAPPAGG